MWRAGRVHLHTIHARTWVLMAQTLHLDPALGLVPRKPSGLGDVHVGAAVSSGKWRLTPHDRPWRLQCRRATYGGTSGAVDPPVEACREYVEFQKHTDRHHLQGRSARRNSEALSVPRREALSISERWSLSEREATASEEESPRTLRQRLARSERATACECARGCRGDDWTAQQRQRWVSDIHT